MTFDDNVERLVLDALIYIIDDEEANVRLLERLLGKHGYRNIVGTTEANTLQNLVASRIPDLLLTDLNMPQMGGLELLQTLTPLKLAVPAVPVLVLTGDSRPDAKRLALKQGVRDFLNKPFDPLEVVCRIHNLLESRIVQTLLMRQNQSLQQQNREGHTQTEVELVRRLAMAAEYGDDPTGIHARRVGRYACLLAERAGMETQECQRLLLAAQLHDLGMLAVPERICMKHGPLDAAEWEIVRAHPMAGSQMLLAVGCDLLNLAEEVARTHHERWDGRGYPHGKSGGDIHLAGRIVGLCDAFEAMTSDRPYRQAWSVTEATNQIQYESGKHFDPELTAQFLDILPAVLQARGSLARV